MKNIIIAIFCLLTFSTSFGQDTKPTKQETMDWIAGKLKEILDGKYIIFHNYSNGIFEFSESEKKYDEQEEREVLFYKTRYIDLNKIKSTEVYFIEKNGNIEILDIFIKGANVLTIKEIRYIDQKVTETSFDQEFKLCGRYFSQYKQGESATYVTNDNYFHFCSDPSLLIRMRKALDNLISFNSSKKETF